MHVKYVDNNIFSLFLLLSIEPLSLFCTVHSLVFVRKEGQGEEDDDE